MMLNITHSRSGLITILLFFLLPNLIKADIEKNNPSFAVNIVEQLKKVVEEHFQNLLQPTFNVSSPTCYDLVTTCFTNGARGESGVCGEGAVVQYGYNDRGAVLSDGDAGTLAATSYLATIGQVGTVWGTAFDKYNNHFYVAAFIRRHSDIGSGGLGAIYQIDLDNPPVNNGALCTGITPWLDINNTTCLGGSATLFPTDPGAASRGLGAKSAPSLDTWAFDKVGKQGMADIDISADGSTMYVIDMTNRQVIVINIAAKTCTQVPVTSPCLGDSEYRPFAVKEHNGDVFIGVTCDGTGATADTSHHVVKFNNPITPTGTTVVASWTTIQWGPNSYDKWESWSDDYFNDFYPGEFHTGGDRYVKRMQSILTDIEFDADGDMVVGLTSRHNFQLGWANYSPDSTNYVLKALAYGDVQNATESAGNYTPNQPNSQWTFYETADFTEFGDETQEGTFIGGLVISDCCGIEYVTAQMQDPHDYESNGVAWIDNATGQTQGGTLTAGRLELVYLGGSNPGAFGKSTALGDLEMLIPDCSLQITTTYSENCSGGGPYTADWKIGFSAIEKPDNVISYQRNSETVLTHTLTGTTDTLTISGVPADGGIYDTIKVWFTNETTCADTIILKRPVPCPITTTFCEVVLDGDFEAGDFPGDGTLTAFAGGTGVDFEDETPDSWLQATNVSKGGNYWIESTAAYSGNKYVYQFSSGKTEDFDDACSQYDVDELTGGSCIQICVYAADANADGNSSGMAIEIEEYPSNNFVYGNFELADNPAWDDNALTVIPWKQYCYTFTTQANTNTGRIWISASAEVGASAISYVVVDDISVCECGGSEIESGEICSTVGSNDIKGTVFEDWNYDGIMNQSDTIGVQGIQVLAYDCTNNLIATTYTDINGNYEFTNLTTGADYRIEFNLPETVSCWAKPTQAGVDNGTMVQFVQPGNCASLGVASPVDYCESDPMLATPCYVNGDPLVAGTAASMDVLVGFPYSASGIAGFSGPDVDHLAVGSEMGSTWGLTYNRKAQTIYTASFLRRHIGLGSLGLGGIYQVDMSSGTAVVSDFIDVSTLGVPVGSIGSNSARGLDGNASMPNADSTTVDEIAKIGLGDIDISEDDQTLWFVNLANQTLYSIDISGGGTPTASDLIAYPIPNPGCIGGTWRPFALKVYRGDIYIGGVCDAQSSQDSTNLQATVYRFSNNSFNNVLTFSLNYDKGSLGSRCSAEMLDYWHPWSNTIADNCDDFADAYPQPVLSDIEFDVDGSMVIGFFDRFGHQTGYKNYFPDGTLGTQGTEGENGVSSGDILRASFNNGIYNLESNGTSGSTTTTGTGNGQGPDGGEYYLGDNDVLGFETHNERSLGGLAILPDSGQVILTVYNPTGAANTNGINWLNNTTGERNDSYQIIGSSAVNQQGKAGGLGDLELLCAAAPLEIGNYVWQDTDNDGIQDACEPGIENVRVELYSSAGVLLAFDTTDANGQYYFSHSDSTDQHWIAATDSLEANTTYHLVVGRGNFLTNQLTLSGNDYTLTTDSLGSSANRYAIDSDAEVVTSSPANAFNNLPATQITTGDWGCVDHGFDFGFVLNLCSVSIDTFFTDNCSETGADQISDLSVVISWVDAPSGEDITVTLDNGNAQTISVSTTGTSPDTVTFAGLKANYGIAYQAIVSFSTTTTCADTTNVYGECSDICSNNLNNYVMNWSDIGWANPTGAGQFPDYTQTFSDIDGSGVNMTVIVHEEPNTTSGYQMANPGCDPGRCDFDTELTTYLPSGDVFRHFRKNNTSVDSITISFSEPILLDTFLFGGNRPPSDGDYGVSQLTFWDGPNGTGNQVGPNQRTYADITKVDTITVENPLSINAPMNVLEGTTMGGNVLGRQTMAYANGSFFSFGEERPASRRPWGALNLDSVYVQSIKWSIYASSSNDPLTTLDNRVNSGSLSAYISNFRFQKCATSIVCPFTCEAGEMKLSFADAGWNAGAGWDDHEQITPQTYTNFDGAGNNVTATFSGNTPSGGQQGPNVYTGNTQGCTEALRLTGSNSATTVAQFPTETLTFDNPIDYYKLYVGGMEQRNGSGRAEVSVVSFSNDGSLIDPSGFTFTPLVSADVDYQIYNNEIYIYGTTENSDGLLSIETNGTTIDKIKWAVGEITNNTFTPDNYVYTGGNSSQWISPFCYTIAPVCSVNITTVYSENCTEPTTNNFTADWNIGINVETAPDNAISYQRNSETVQLHTLTGTTDTLTIMGIPADGGVYDTLKVWFTNETSCADTIILKRPTPCPTPISPLSTCSAYAASGTVAEQTCDGNRVWNNIANIQTDDATFARTTANLTSSLPNSNCLEFTGFGFSIPATATITGVNISVRRKGETNNSTVDKSIQLLVGGTATGNDKASLDLWSNISFMATYGGQHDLWGTTLTPTEVNAANFGFAFQAKRQASTGEAHIEYVEMSICYSDVETTEAGGTVYEDWNFNGIQEDKETSGVQGVQVLAYDCDNNLAATTYTDIYGNYKFTGLTAGAEYRMEFILPEAVACWAKPTQAGANSGTTVQFVQAGNLANLGLINLADYCQENPQLLSACFTRGDIASNGSELAILSSFESEAKNTGTAVDAFSTTHNINIPLSDVGSIWGLAYAKNCDNIFAAATVKTQTEIAPDGIGAIYVIDNTANTNNPGETNTVTSATLWLDLEDAAIGLNLGDNPYDTEAYTDGFNRTAYAAVGKHGIGDIDVAEDGSALFATNLYNRTLLEIPIGANCAAPVSGSEIKEIALPTPASCTDVIRPWAVKVNKGKVYVGMVCTGEQSIANNDDRTGIDRSILIAYVYEYDPIAGIFGGSPVLEFPLNYDRTWTANGLPVAWYPWFDRFVWDMYFTEQRSGTDIYLASYAQPILSDIEFDGCNMVIGLLDRAGNQFGYGPPPNDELANGTIQQGYPAGATNILIYPGGDLLLAGANADGTWTIESNGSITSICGDKVTLNGDPQDLRSSLPAPHDTETGAGPGGGEFFWGDYYGSGHNEVTIGALAIRQSSGEIISMAWDPLQHVASEFGIGGAMWLNTTTGEYEKGIKLYENNVLSFQKGSGFGDAELICGDAPIEIGNYVWEDTDGDGIQNACEPGIENVRVELYSSTGVFLAFDTTDVNGQYYFSHSDSTDQNWIAATDSVEANTTYHIVVGRGDFSANQLSLSGNDYTLTSDSLGSSSNRYAIDSDAEVVTSSPVNTFDNLPATEISTGDWGCVDHSFDIGFKPLPCLEITELITTRSICHGENIDTLAVLTTFENPDSIAFVYFETQQTDSAVIYTGGMGIDTIQITSGSDTARITNVPGFTSDSCTTVYYVYAIAYPTPTNETCRPYEEIVVNVNAGLNTTISENQTICIGETPAPLTSVAKESTNLLANNNFQTQNNQNYFAASPDFNAGNNGIDWMGWTSIRNGGFNPGFLSDRSISINPPGYYNAQSGDYSFLAFSTSNNGTTGGISQDIDVEMGETYCVSFYHAPGTKWSTSSGGGWIDIPNAGEGWNVAMTGSSTYSQFYPIDLNNLDLTTGAFNPISWTLETFEFTATSTGTTTLSFVSSTTTSGTASYSLDNVSVYKKLSSGPSYQWQSSTTSCTEGFSDISGATSDTYTPNAIAQTTYFRLISSLTNGCSSGMCADTSNCATVIVYPEPTLTASPSACEEATNTYSLTGTLNFSDAPSTGTLVIRVADGESQVFTAPFSSPQNFVFSNLNSDGAIHEVEAYFTNGGCSQTLNYTAPAVCVCDSDSCPSGGTLGFEIHKDTIAYQTTNLNQSFSIPKFDNMGGTRTLQKILLSVGQSVRSSGVIESTDAQSSDVSLTLTGTGLVELDGSTLSTTNLSFESGSVNVLANISVSAQGSWGGDVIGSTLFGMAGIVSTNLNNLTDPRKDAAWVTNATENASHDDDMVYFAPIYADTTVNQVFTSNPDLAKFTGAGNVDLVVDVQASSSISGSGNLQSIVQTRAQAIAFVKYVYCDESSICSEINEASLDKSICHGENVDSLAVRTTFENPDSIAFVYFTTPQIDSILIYTNGVGIDTVQIAVGNDTARITNISGLTATGSTPDTFYVYAIVHPAPSNNSCRPYEEIRVVVYPCDYGDLPDIADGTTGITDYETYDSTGGPSHLIIAGLFLGDTVDVDNDGFPDADALGDDNDNVDDEDGVTILESLDVRPDGIIRLPLSVTNTTGDTAYIEAWIDWNGDGDFDIVNEMVADYKDNKDGVFPAYIVINVPANALIGNKVGFRVRLSNTDNMTPYGRINSGEIEDYLLGIDCPQVICLPIDIELKRE